MSISTALSEGENIVDAAIGFLTRGQKSKRYKHKKEDAAAFAALDRPGTSSMVYIADFLDIVKNHYPSI